MQHINLETFANGAFTAQVNRAIEEVTREEHPGSEHGCRHSEKDYGNDRI